MNRSPHRRPGRPFGVFVVVALATACASSEPVQGSIGVVLGRAPDSGRVVVRDVPGEELLEAPLLPGDRLVSIDGVEVESLDAEALRRMLRGPVGSKLRVTVLRGDEVLRLELARVPLRELGARRAPAEERISE